MVGRCLLRAGVPAQTLACDLATSEPQLPGRESAAEGQLLCRVSVGISRRDALRAGVRRPAHPVPRMSPEVTSSYLCGCSVSPQPLPLSPIFIVLWEVPQKTSYRQAPTTSGRTKTNRKRICVWGPKRYRVGQKFHSGLSQRSEQNFWPAYNVQGEIRIVVNSFCCFRMWVCILSVSSPWHTWPLEACICSVDLPTPPCVPALLTPVSAPGPSPSSRGWVSPVAPTSPSLCLGQLEQPPPLPSNSSCSWFRSWVWGNLPPLLRYFP